MSRFSILALCVLILGCQGKETAATVEPESQVVLGDKETLAAFDYATGLVTHDVPFASAALDPKTVEVAQAVGKHACRMAQRDDESDKETSVKPLSEELKREAERLGSDPYLGLEIARVVAACYARKLGKQTSTPLAKAMFLSVASNCASRRGISTEAMSRLMLALYDSQEVSLTAFSSTLAQAKSRPIFSRHLLHGTEVCPQLADVAYDATEPVPTGGQAVESKEDGRVYVGILRGRAPGRIRLVMKERVIEGVVTIGSKKMTVSGKIGRFNTLNLTGRLGMETLELSGKLKERARQIRGRYNGKIQRRNQPRSSRVMGFWEAKLDVSASP